MQKITKPSLKRELKSRECVKTFEITIYENNQKIQNKYHRHMTKIHEFGAPSYKKVRKFILFL